MLKPRAFIKQAALGLVSVLFSGSALLAQIAIDPSGSTGGGSSNTGTPGSKLNGPKADDPAGRIDWWRQRLGGDLTPEFMAHVMSEADKQRQLYPDQFPSGPATNISHPEGVPLPLASTLTTWTNLGSTKSNKIQNGIVLTNVNSGRLRTILPDPTDPNTLYILSSGGGLWKTNNLLSSPPTWRFLSDRVGSTMGGSVAFGKVNTGVGTTLYLGLGDAFDLGVGGFVIKSSDAGTTWSAPIQLTGTVGATTYTATRILDLKVDTTGASDVILVGTNAGLFRSTNSGVSYSIVNNASFNGKYVWSLIRTGVSTWVASVEDYAVAGGTGALLRSTDGGVTWGVSGTIAGAGRMTLGIGAPGDAIAYCFAANTGDAAQLNLYRTTTGGTAWAATSTTSASTPAQSNADQGNNDYMHTQAFYNHMLLVDPSDATRNTVYVGGNLSSAKSTNGGGSWTVLSNWLAQYGRPYVHADFHCAAFTNAGGTARVMFGSDGGLFISANGGTTFDDTKNIGLITHLIYAMDSGPLNNCDANSVLMGLQDNGNHNRIGATSVFDQTSGGDGFGVAWSQATNAYSFCAYVFNAFSRCTVNPPDDQSKWSNFVGGLGSTGGTDNGASYYFVTPIITAPAGADSTGSVFYTYGNTGTGTNSKKIFRTTGGANWAALGTLPSVGSPAAKLGVRAVSHGVAAHPTDPNRLAAACNGGYLITTINAGTLWTPILLSTAVPAVGGRTWQGYNSGAEWVSNNILFACSESTLVNSIHVAKSLDGGATWAAAETGLPDLPVVKLLCDQGDATGNTLYAATWLGVYRTLNGGTSWSLFGTGMPQSLVTDLYIHPTSAFLRASVWGRGIWQVGPTPTYTAPSFSIQPASGTFTPPAAFTLSPTISNTYPTATYQWRRNGVNIAGATSASLTVTPTTCSSGGDFTLVATNCAGTTISNVATVTSTVAAPIITTQPANVRYAVGTNFTLSVTATGTGLTYQWRRAGINLTNVAPYSNVTTPTLTVTSPVAGTAGSFDCVVTGSGGCIVTSNAATVATTVSAANIITNPVDTTVNAPANATFSVTAGGGGVGGATTAVTIAFQWRKNSVNLTNAAPNTWTNASIAVSANPGTATSVLTVGPTTDTSGGVFYDCIATTSGGSATSSGAKLTVNRTYTPATAVSIASSLPTAAFGTPVTFTAVGSGSVLGGTATAAPASAYQYQFWVYLDDALGWTMVQDYSATNTYVMPGTTQPGGYGVGVDCRTSSTALWDTFNSIDYFVITPIAHGPSVPLTNTTARPKFMGGHSAIR
jgi:hypothetical protein